MTEFVLSQVMLNIRVQHDGPFWQWHDAPKALEVRTFSNTGELWIGFLAFCVAEYAESVLCVDDDVVCASQSVALVAAGDTIGGTWFRVSVPPGQFCVVSLRVRGDVTVHQRLLHVRDTPPTDTIGVVPVSTIFGR